MLQVNYYKEERNKLNIFGSKILNILLLLLLAYLEEIDSLRAFQVLFDYIQAYPRHAYKYLVSI